jgi:hypothetical protein
MFDMECMHLTHKHFLHLNFLNFLPDEARKSCYGRYSKTGCKGEGIENMRYFVCFECTQILCEKCFIAPPTDFMLNLKKNIHKHVVRENCYSEKDAWK